jgi:hypothetical protein
LRAVPPPAANRAHRRHRIGGSGPIGAADGQNGIYDHVGQTVTPSSLYLEQLKERLGETAVHNIGY